MKIENKKQLKEILQLCRKLGVQSMKVDGIEFHLGEMPQQERSLDDLIEDPLASAKITTSVLNQEYTGSVTNSTKAIAEKIASDSLSEEELLFYSVREDSGKTSGRDISES